MADVLQNFRSALDRLTKSVGFAVSGPGKWDGHFPIHDNEEGWNQWLKKHPIDIEERFRAFEPFVSGRPALTALRDLNNLEKHDIGLSMSATLSELSVDGGRFRVEGVLDESAFVRELAAAFAEPPTLDAPRRAIATISMPARIISLPNPGDVRPDFTISPVVDVGDHQISLQDLLSGIAHEVTWAIAYVVGLEKSASVPPTEFDL